MGTAIEKGSSADQGASFASTVVSVRGGCEDRLALFVSQSMSCVNKHRPDGQRKDIRAIGLARKRFVLIA